MHNDEYGNEIWKDYQDPLETYQQQFKEIYAAIKNRDRGYLYAAIKYIDPENSEDICHYFGIDKNSTLNNEFKFCKSFLFSPIKDLSIFQIPLLEGIAKMIEQAERQAVEFANFFAPVKDNTEILTGIIIVAFILTALYIAVKQSEQRRQLNQRQNLRPPQEQGRNRYLEQAQPRVNELPRKPSVLCLVVPSHQLSGLNQGYPITSNRVEKLISSASYFLCDRSIEAIDKKVNLNLNPGNINYASEEYAYIQLRIPEGEDMIRQKAKYSLKKKLPDGGAQIDKIARLINLDGLENFICA
ncbi:hypothetical protein BJP34_21970 [Moorena producens PAL-8-15-08-1]|uniref:Uncharacterized protein n=1 Tax=Moorena producens PAL-8-15-08-1 TaxID=1458985 RepID=A0A1D8TVS5_9CYAN|nr:hypothetical protein [Moorena producens]AOX01749.1 hypothetical protein BJP34_21970 [Moorena producens PAL-8-15-08-1]